MGLFKLFFGLLTEVLIMLHMGNDKLTSEVTDLTEAQLNKQKAAIKKRYKITD